MAAAEGSSSHGKGTSGGDQGTRGDGGGAKRGAKSARLGETWTADLTKDDPMDEQFTVDVSEINNRFDAIEKQQADHHAGILAQITALETARQQEATVKATLVGTAQAISQQVGEWERHIGNRLTALDGKLTGLESGRTRLRDQVRRQKAGAEAAGRSLEELQERHRRLVDLAPRGLLSSHWSVSSFDIVIQSLGTPPSSG